MINPLCLELLTKGLHGLLLGIVQGVFRLDEQIVREAVHVQSVPAVCCAMDQAADVRFLVAPGTQFLECAPGGWG